MHLLANVFLVHVWILYRQYDEQVHFTAVNVYVGGSEDATFGLCHVCVG